MVSIKKFGYITILTLLTISMISFGSVYKVYAQETVLKAVAPTQIGPPGENFTVSVVAENILEDNGMYGWEIVLTWPQGLVNCTEETLNLNIWPSYLGPWVTDPIDNDNGKYWQSVTATAPSDPVSGTYWLVNLTFTVIAEPCNYVNFTFELPQGYAAYCLLNQNAEEIPHEFQGSEPHIVPEFPTMFMLATVFTITTALLASKKKFFKKL